MGVKQTPDRMINYSAVLVCPDNGFSAGNELKGNRLAPILICHLTCDVNCFQPKKYLYKLEKLQEDELSLYLIHYCGGIYCDLIGNASAEDKEDASLPPFLPSFLCSPQSDEATKEAKVLKGCLIRTEGAGC